MGEMLDFHSKMSCLDRHFCKLYDRKERKLADGNDIIWEKDGEYGRNRELDSKN
jgi:hypothetical protein